MPPTIRQGDTGNAVRECQALLCVHSFTTDIDGIFGAGTTKQVKAFQSSEGLTVDGIVGTGTWAALEQSFPDRSIPIQWSVVVTHFAEMFTQRYLLSGAQCPSNPPGMSLKRIGTETTNCVLFTAWLLSKAFNDIYKVKFTGTQWSDWMVSASTPDSKVPGYGPRVAKEWGCGVTSPGDGPWLVQLFRPSGGGHSLIVVDHDPKTDKILTLEASSTIDGAGWYEIGPLREVYNPGPDWANQVSQTWSSRFSGVEQLHVIRLNISIESIRDWLQEGA